MYLGGVGKFVVFEDDAIVILGKLTRLPYTFIKRY